MPLDNTGFEERFGPLDKMDRVIELLATEDRWCQGQSQSCQPSGCGWRKPGVSRCHPPTASDRFVGIFREWRSDAEVRVNFPSDRWVSR
jgi:hypothetical protein